MGTCCSDDPARATRRTPPLGRCPRGIERDFLRTLEGGCTAPIGAYATINDDVIELEGILLSIDGQTKIEVKKQTTLSNHKNFGVLCAQEVLENGGTELMLSIKTALGTLNK